MKGATSARAASDSCSLLPLGRSESTTWNVISFASPPKTETLRLAGVTFDSLNDAFSSAAGPGLLWILEQTMCQNITPAEKVVNKAAAFLPQKFSGTKEGYTFKAGKNGDGYCHQPRFNTFLHHILFVQILLRHTR